MSGACAICISHASSVCRRQRGRNPRPPPAAAAVSTAAAAAIAVGKRWRRFAALANLSSAVAHRLAETKAFSARLAILFLLLFVVARRALSFAVASVARERLIERRVLAVASWICARSLSRGATRGAACSRLTIDCSEFRFYALAQKRARERVHSAIVTVACSSRDCRLLVDSAPRQTTRLVAGARRKMDL